MKVSVNDNLCQGHARCFVIEPQVFDLDDHGHAVTLAVDVDATLEGAVRDAAANCPERAITLIDVKA